MVQRENELQRLLSLREKREVDKQEWQVCITPIFSLLGMLTLTFCYQGVLADEGFDNDAAFDATIKKLEANLKKAKKKDNDGEGFA